MRHSVDAYGQTTVMVTHDARAAEMADRVLFLGDGLIVKELPRSSAHDILIAMEELETRDDAFALSGLLARKLRTVLTALAIILGVAMVSGTFVLTDSITGAFDSIFASTYRNTDAVVSGKSAFKLSGNNGADRSVVRRVAAAKVKALPDVAAALGGVEGDAHLIGKNGKAIVFGGAPNIGFSVDPTQPRFNSLTLYKGAWPERRRGDRRQVDRREEASRRSVRRSASSRAARSSSSASPVSPSTAPSRRSAARRSPASTSRPRRTSSTSPASSTRSASRRSRASTQQKLLAEIKSILPPGTQVRTGDAQASKDAEDTNSFLVLPAEVPARLRRRRALRRLLRDRELALDHDRAAHARVRDAAHARRVAAPGLASPCSSSRS